MDEKTKGPAVDAEAVRREQRKRVYEVMGRMVGAARLERKWSEKELGVRVAMEAARIEALEQGSRWARVHELYLLAEALEVEPASLVPTWAELAEENLAELKAKSLTKERWWEDAWKELFGVLGVERRTDLSPRRGLQALIEAARKLRARAEGSPVGEKPPLVAGGMLVASHWPNVGAMLGVDPEKLERLLGPPGPKRTGLNTPEPPLPTADEPAKAAEGRLAALEERLSDVNDGTALLVGDLRGMIQDLQESVRAWGSAHAALAGKVEQLAGCAKAGEGGKGPPTSRGGAAVTLSVTEDKLRAELHRSRQKCSLPAEWDVADVMDVLLRLGAGENGGKGSPNRTGLNTPEPAPQPNGGRAIWELVIEDMKARDAAGRAKYDVPLQAHNGRDSLVDLYQELLDAVAYVRQVIEEGRSGAPAASSISPTAPDDENGDSRAVRQERLRLLAKQLGRTPAGDLRLVRVQGRYRSAWHLRGCEGGDEILLQIGAPATEVEALLQLEAWVGRGMMMEAQQDGGA